MTSRFKTLIQISLFGLISMIAVSCTSSGPAQSNDQQQFQSLVLEKMPGYRLTAALNGGPVIKSPAYAISVYNGLLGTKPPRDLIWADFLSRFEDTGLKSTTIYFGSRVPKQSGKQFWRVDFSGCKPGKCGATLTSTQYVSVSQAVHDRYYSLSAITAQKGKRSEILRATLSGVNYFALLRVGYDYRGRVIKYSVTTYRDPVTAREKRKAQRVPSLGKAQFIQVHRYVHNVVLSRTTELNGPRRHGSTPDMQLEGF